MKSALPLLLLGCMALQVSAFSTPNNRASSSVSTTTQLFAAPEPLASEGEWTAYLDEETTGVVYYFNSRTGESRWEPPTNTFPSVYLKPSRKRKADDKKAEYYKSLQLDEEKGKGFFSSILEKALPKEEEEKLKEEEEPEWMKTILEEKYPAEEEEKPGFFSRLLNKQPEVAPAPAPVVEEPEPEPEPKQEKGPGFLNNLLLNKQPEAAPAPAPVVEEPEPEPKLEKGPGFLNNLFDQMTADAVAETQETQEVKAARIAEEQRVAAEKTTAAAKAEAAKRKEQEVKAAEEARFKEQEQKQAEEERIMMERVRKAEVEQKAEADRLEAEAKKAEVAEAKRAAEEAKREAAAARKAEQEARKQASVVEESIVVEEQPRTIQVEIGSCVLPHPSKMMWGGEDAVFTKGRTFGVFDGVSGADKMDGLPLYSKMLARQMTQLVGTGNDLTIKDLQDQLLTAAEIADERATGASTAVVASITEDGFLRAINLGDSACIVVRGNKVVAKTKEIIHYFDCPYQLSEISPDRPRDARKLNFELLRGDTVLMGSDGIFDNLDDAELVELVNSGGPTKAIAKRVSDRSRKVSLNSKAATPYSRQAKRNGDPDFRDGLGGKVDDISCVVVRYD